MSRIMGFTHDRLAAAGHEVAYFCTEDAPERLRGRASRFAFPLLALRRAAAAARAGRPFDIVNIHEPVSSALCLYKRLAGSPVVVVTSHGVERRGWELALEELRLGREGPSLKTRLVFPLTSLWQSAVGLRRADHIFCLNTEDRDYLMRWLRRPAERFTRIFPAADPVYATAAAGRDHGRGSRLLFAATWRKNKGVEDLVPAFAMLARRRPETTLTVLGAGAPEDAVRRAFPEDVRGRVRCVRAGSDAEAAAVLASCDVYLLPSLFEGTPLTLIEAMMSGLPIVTTATCGMADVIRDGRNGLLIPIRSPRAILEATERLLSDAGLRVALGAAAREDALRHYTWELASRPIQEAYERLCAARATRERGAAAARHSRRPSNGNPTP